MTNPMPPGAGDPLPPPDPLRPYQAYQPVPYAPPQPYGTPVGYGYDPGGQPAGYPYDYGYGSPYGYPGPPPRDTDGMAIASLVVSCVSVAGLCAWGVGGLLGVLGAIFGHVARRRIRTTGAGGAGIALAGIIVGWVMAAIGVLLITLLVVLIATTEDTGAGY
jgi:hypothetical protein